MKKQASRKSVMPKPQKPRTFKKSAPSQKQPKPKKKEAVIFERKQKKSVLPKPAKQPIEKKQGDKPAVVKAMAGKQFPKIPRFIPEVSFPQQLNVLGLLWKAIKGVAQDKWLTYPTTILLFVVGIALVGLDLSRNLLLLQQENHKKNDLLRQEAYWQEIARKHPDYRDAYFTLALITYQLKDFPSAKRYIEKTMSLDPNFDKGKELEQLLEGK